jgi:hypothetical protein
MSPSVPFFTVSEQLGAAQAPPAHTPFAQSTGRTHSSPVPQPPQAPPQSTSLSPPFFTPSLQPASAQTPPEHTPLTQSPPTLQL